MLALRLAPPQSILPVQTLVRQCHPRWLHDQKGSWASWERHHSPKPEEPRREENKFEGPLRHGPEHKDFLPWELRQPQRRLQESKHQEHKNHKFRHQGSKSQEPQRLEPKHDELSLFEELFPEEAKKQLNHDRKLDHEEQHIPRLRLPDLDEVEQRDQYDGSQARPSHLTKAASRAAFRQWNLAILVLQRVSKSLDDSDFRRIAPKGEHIEDWKGPGDPLKVIPGRDPSTLQPLGHYFLLFPNPAYARAYQNHVIHTHRLATTHTPTSLESPIAPPKGMIIEGDDVHALLQDYALCPPSQKISLKMVFPPYSAGVKKLIDQRGYAQLVQPLEKAGRSVLFWVNGYQPSTSLVRNTIAQDGRNRGMEWALLNSRKSIEKLDVPNISSNDEDMVDFDSREVEDREEQGTAKRMYPRWIIAFEDEDEARRFVRAWHRRPFAASRDLSLQDEPSPLVHAEFLW